MNNKNAASCIVFACAAAGSFIGCHVAFLMKAPPLTGHAARVEECKNEVTDSVPKIGNPYGSWEEQQLDFCELAPVRTTLIHRRAKDTTLIKECESRVTAYFDNRNSLLLGYQGRPLTGHEIAERKSRDISNCGGINYVFDHQRQQREDRKSRLNQQ